MHGIPPNRQVLEDIRKLSKSYGLLPFVAITPPIGAELREKKKFGKKEKMMTDFEDSQKIDHPKITPVRTNNSNPSSKFLPHHSWWYLVVKYACVFLADILVVCSTLAIVVFLFIPDFLRDLSFSSWNSLQQKSGIFSQQLLYEVAGAFCLYLTLLKIIASRTLGSLIFAGLFEKKQRN